MKFDKIVGFGDSWTYGDELVAPEILARDPGAHACLPQNDNYRLNHGFLGLLARHYDVTFENFGVPGGSLQSTIWTFLWWLEQQSHPERCLVLVGLPNSDRYSLYDPGHVHHGNDPAWNMFVHSSWVDSGSAAIQSDFRDLCQRYTALTTCTELSVYNYLQALLLFDGACARNGIGLVQFHICQPPRLSATPVPSLVWPQINLREYFLTHPDNQDRRYFKPRNHPNESGHQLIRDLLIPEIDRVTLHE